jgi:hypothetical protein
MRISDASPYFRTVSYQFIGIRYIACRIDTWDLKLLFDKIPVCGIGHRGIENTAFIGKFRFVDAVDLYPFKTGFPGKAAVILPRISVPAIC